MSFILDALRKSESERQRQLGPALLSLPVSSGRRGVPPWGWLVAALLGVNLVLLLWLALRSPEPAPKIAVAPAPAQRAPPAPAASVPVQPVSSVVPGTAVEAAHAPPAYVAVAPRPRQPATSADDSAGNPADLEPAVEPSGGGASPETIPSYAAVSDHVPALRLDLHVYAADRDDRYALINMHKVREGDTLPEGPRVLRITRDAVILNYQGEEFSLGRE